MKNIRLHIAYQGTHFHGWQRQPDCSTVEGEIRTAISKLLNSDAFEFQGASRTDAGVHAAGQVANLKHDTNRSVWDFVRGLNAMTPNSIRINHAEEIGLDFNARHHSDGKRYRYQIFRHRFPNPLQGHLQWEVKGDLNVDNMREAGQCLLGDHDFSAFRASDCQALSTVRSMHEIRVEEHATHLEIVVVGNAFLKNMVRIITGTLVEVGLGQKTVEQIPGILNGRVRAAAGRTAPARGLLLDEVFYPDHPWSKAPSLFLNEHYHSK